LVIFSGTRGSNPLPAPPVDSSKIGFLGTIWQLGGCIFMVAQLSHEHLEIEPCGDVIVVNILVRKVLDEQTIQTIRDLLLQRVADDDPQQVLLNLGNVEALSSLALSMLIGVHKHLLAAGKRLVLHNLSEELREILRTTRLDQLFCVEQATWTAHLSPAWRDSSDAPPARESLSPQQAGSPVLLCDPSEERGRRLRAALAPHLGVLCFGNVEALEHHCRAHLPAAIALPLEWSACDGPTDSPVLGFIRAHAAQTAIVAYGQTSRLPLRTYCQVLAAGAKKVVNEASPSFVADLRQTLTRLVTDHQAHLAEQRQLASLFEQQGLIGRSPALQAVFLRAIKAAEFSDLPVLLLGETGTGKQRLAEAIHRLDPRRRGKPFITLNCSAVNKTLAESELFGHTRGAFSGASTERLGVFRAADGGTLLLDEIGELDPELQPKLLRVLQDRHLLPVGADYEHQVDVRIIAATNRPLEDMVRQRRFRDDLYQRLNVFQIRIPPLRDRPLDVEAQARHFLKLYAPRPELPQDIDPQVLELWQCLPWEGNTRQLENLIREILTHQPAAERIGLEDLPAWVLDKLVEVLQLPPSAQVADTPPPQALAQKMSLEEALNDYERQLVQAALQRNAGNRTRTAADLGITVRSIFNKIKKHGLNR
jgi:anti-anti-sigma factor